MAKPPPLPASPETLFSDLESYIREAVDILDSGEYAELKHLEIKTAALCAHIQALPGSDAVNYRTRLVDTIRQLDLLQTLMHDHKNKVQGQLQGLDAKKRASRAYAKSESMLPLSHPED
jgi:hypothetical protein